LSIAAAPGSNRTAAKSNNLNGERASDGIKNSYNNSEDSAKPVQRSPPTGKKKKKTKNKKNKKKEKKPKDVHRENVGEARKGIEQRW